MKMTRPLFMIQNKMLPCYHCVNNEYHKPHFYYNTFIYETNQ